MTQMRHYGENSGIFKIGRSLLLLTMISFHNFHLPAKTALRAAGIFRFLSAGQRLQLELKTSTHYTAGTTSLWDIRVDDEYKRQGIGQVLFNMAVK